MKLNRLVAATIGLSAVFAASLATASHTWNNYHWARTTSSFALQTLDSTASTAYVNWPLKLANAAGQWSQSNVLDLNTVRYDNSSNGRRKCSAVAGKIRVCNQSYGRNGWLGLASINLDSNGHISQGTAKMNDSYSSTWANDANEAAHVMCQEVGHTFGLGHTSEDGTSQSTCMDYSSSPNSTMPNQHDYDQLASQYSHTDSYNSYSTSAAKTASAAQSAMAGVPLGTLVRRGHFSETYAAPDGKGGLWITHVTLAPGSENIHAE